MQRPVAIGSVLSQLVTRHVKFHCKGLPPTLSQVFSKLVRGTWEGAHNLSINVCNISVIADRSDIHSPIGILPGSALADSPVKVPGECANRREFQDRAAASD